MGIVDGENNVLANVTAHQEEVHERFGGIVPELASRKHVENLLPVLRFALEKAGLSYQEITAIAVTNRHGLIGSLIIGVSAAKTIAHSLKIPLIPVDHLQAHLASVILGKEPVTFPALGLIISGGHSSLYEISKNWETFTALGHTRDDAAGEAFDKAARILGMPYPGGPQIAKHALEGNPNAIHFPRALPGRSTLDFSFSGLKTALQNLLTHEKEKYSVADICASFQEAIADALIAKTLIAIENKSYQHLLVAGGVAANQRLREKLQKTLPPYCTLHVPPVELCTDNGAMIAVRGKTLFEQKNYLEGDAIFSLSAEPKTEARAARGKI